MRLPRALALTTVACASLWGACQSNSAAADGKTHIRFAGNVSSPAETDLVKKLVANFNASQSEIVVSYEPVPGQYEAKLLTMLVSKTAPDVFYLDTLIFRPFLSKNVLRPLDDLMARSQTTRPEHFIASLVRSFTEGGHLYGIPKDFNSLGLFYNREMFDEASLPYPDHSWDLEKLRSVAMQLTRPASQPPRYGFALNHDGAERFLPIAKAYGASMFAADGKCAIASPEAVAAMNFYAGLKLVDHAAIYPSEIGTTWTGDVFARQRAAMVFEGGWLVPYLNEAFPEVKYGVSELPSGPKARSNFLFTVAYVIPQSSQHAEAAWKLIEYLTSEEAQAQVTFAIPSRVSISQQYVQAHPDYQPLLEGATYGEPWEFGRKGKRIGDRLGVAVQEIFLGAKQPGAALSDAAKEIDSIGKL